MVNINECTVRYLLGPVDLMNHEFIHQLKTFVYSDYNEGWLPEMLIQTDEGCVWAYFTAPLKDIERQLLIANTIFDFTWEESLV